MIFGIGRLSYRTWGQFKADYMSDLFHASNFVRERFLFRGQGGASYKLSTSFDRYFERLRGQERNRIAERLIKEFRDEMERSGLSSTDGLEEIDLIALAQHHGVPTRLLDWTESPYVAAFFAFASSVKAAASENEVAIWALDTSKTDVWSAANGVEVICAARHSNARLRNQEGRFTLSKTPFSCLEEYVAALRNRGSLDGNETALVRILVPKTEALAALGDLDAMRIRYSTLFPDMTGAAEMSKLRVMLEVKGRP